jgi:hypothetical protein
VAAVKENLGHSLLVDVRYTDSCQEAGIRVGRNAGGGQNMK